MLEKVWIVITEEDEKTEEQAKRLKKRLQSEGLEAGMEPFFSDSRKPQPAAGELYLTDCPEAVGRLAGENCRILLYLTEKSRKLSMTEYPYAVEDLEEIDAGYLEGIYRRLAGEPWEILRTKRLLVREQREEDLDSLYEIYAHPDMTAYMEGLAVDREEERERLRSYIRTVYPLYGFGLWMLVEKKRGLHRQGGLFLAGGSKAAGTWFCHKEERAGTGVLSGGLPGHSGIRLWGAGVFRRAGAVAGGEPGSGGGAHAPGLSTVRRHSGGREEGRAVDSASFTGSVF